MEADVNYAKETFAFDPASNLLDPDAPPGPNPHSPRKLMDNVLRSYCGTQYRYDERGNLLERIENGETGKFTWDLYDRLRRYEDDRLVVEFGYDALGRRVYKDSHSKYRNRVQAGPVWNENAKRALDEQLGCDLTLFVWDGDTLAFEQKGRDGEGQTIHYIFEPGTFIPISQGVMDHIEELLVQPNYDLHHNVSGDLAWEYKPSPKPFDRYIWYQCDHLGTPMEIIDERAKLTWRGQYHTFGFTADKLENSVRNIQPHNPIRFQGQLFDTETKLHYNRYRYYESYTNRFVSKDPIGMMGGLNLYTYAPNPISWTDPLGLKSKKCPEFSATECRSLLAKITQKALGKKNINGSRGLLERVDHLALDEHNLYNNAYTIPAVSGPAMGKGTYKGHIDAASDLKRGLNRDIDAYHRANCKGYAKIPINALKASSTLIPQKPVEAK